ncbi:Radical SAM domain protein [Ignisphaera aggregans DSM 17230]|uniref:Radical SAM domain protein n=1 Tax=Ignisphaera aggregans (strain DSM 17230 / JCM 13409 / AQ1.S1) TaxID=583356 RepID=E0SSI9_IGNAA|nr:Radical SAM domain protein [Ignisphaera aggregans DSM 17230]
MPELVINISNVVSPLCYSLIRLEPYTTCIYGCVYCYARWYRRESDIVRPRVNAVKEFSIYARKIYRRDLLPIPARLSTLIDPFIPHEELFKTSLSLLRIALDYEYPIIINTKSILLLRDPWRRVIERLADRGLVSIQISVSTLDQRISSSLEPYASTPSERLSMAREFSSIGIPIAVRLSPYIPRISIYPSIEELANIFKDHGVRHVVVEVLRLESSSIESFLRGLGLDIDVESYSLRIVEGLTPISRISLGSRIDEYIALSKTLARYGIGFATCKEGLYSIHTAYDCCGMYLLKRSIAYRATLMEIYRIAREWNGIPLEKIGDAMDILLKQGYLVGEKLRLYPKRVSKPLKNHEKKLLRVLKSRDMVIHIAPSLDIVDGRIIARDIDDTIKTVSRPR